MAAQPEPKNGIQKLFGNLFARSDEQRAAMELESRSWMVQCPYCGYQRSVWEWGGVRYKAAGTSRQLRKCPNCGRTAWHRVYKSVEPAPAGVAPIPAGRIPLPRPMLWILGIGLLVTAIAAFIILLVMILNAALQPVVTVGDAFMTGLKNGDYSKAYALCTPELQGELGGVSGLTTLVRGHQPAKWDWYSRSVRNGTGRLDGSLTYANKATGKVHLVLNQVSNEWRISSFSLSPDNP